MQINRIIFIILSIITVAAGLTCASPAPKQNLPPVISQIAGASEWSPGTPGQIICSASDPEGGDLTYKWSADNGTITGQGDKITWVSPDGIGKYNITVTVTDNKGLETTMVKEVKVYINADGTVNPEAPIVLNLTMPSKEVATGAKRIRIWTSSPVECKISGADPTKIKYTWTTANGRLQAKGLTEGTASKVTWIAPGVAGDYTLDVVATDDSGNEAKGTVSFKVFCCGN